MPDSVRGITSITKLFTAVAIMKLVEEGHLHQEQSVSSIIKEFDTNMHRGIRISHLLTHTSGLAADTGYFSEPYQRGWWESFDDKDKDADWIKTMMYGPVQAKPGEQWNYCSSGYAFLGEIISRVSGMSYYDYVLEKIVKPLGMKNTFFDVSESLMEKVCTSMPWDEGIFEWKKNRVNEKWPPDAGGGLYSNLEDMTRFGRMLLNKGELEGVRILGRRTVEEMATNQLQPGVTAYHWGANEKNYIYGLGTELYTKDIFRGTFGHEGSGRCALAVDPAEQLTYMIFVPTGLGWVPESVLNVKSVIWSGLL